MYAKVEGNRELVTIIETICAEGTSLNPTAIFKGKKISAHGDATIPLMPGMRVNLQGFLVGNTKNIAFPALQTAGLMVNLVPCGSKKTLSHRLEQG